MTKTWRSGCFVLPLLLVCPNPILASEPDVITTIDDAQISLIQNTFVAAPIAGIVASVDVSEGDVVKDGKQLIQLRSDQAETELVAAQSAYEAARLESANDVDERYARRTLDVRIRELEQSEAANRNFPGTVSATDIEKLKLVVDQSRLAIEQAEHKRLVAKAAAEEKQAAVRIAAARLQKHSVDAPVAGVVTEIVAQAGEWVEAGKPIVRLISLDPLRAECFIDGRRYGSELVGQVVKFYPQLPSDDDETMITGHVSFVSPELHPVTGQVRAWATIPNPDQKIRAGMRGKLVILNEKIQPPSGEQQPAAADVSPL